MLARCLALLALVACTLPAEDKLADPVAQGQRVFSAGHSFHYFMPPILAGVAQSGGVKDHVQVGQSSIGGSRVHQHWAVAASTVAKDAKEVELPQETIPLASSARFPASGEVKIKTSAGDTTVTYTGIKGNTLTGCKGGTGTLKAGAAVTSATNAAKELLKAGKIDVFTMSPIYLPDDGIENFVKLAVAGNPKIRIFVQENWLPWDTYDPKFKAPAKVDHNAPTGESLRKMHAPYFQSFEDHVRELNKKYNTKAVGVVPMGQAVIALREKILAGAAPTLTKQDDLFTDPIGHAKAPLMALSGYVYYATIYRKSPVGLPAPAVLGGKNADEKLNRLLQEIAWTTVKDHPLAGVQAEPKPGCAARFWQVAGVEGMASP